MNTYRLIVVRLHNIIGPARDRTPTTRTVRMGIHQRLEARTCESRRVPIHFPRYMMYPRATTAPRQFRD